MAVAAIQICANAGCVTRFGSLTAHTSSAERAESVPRSQYQGIDQLPASAAAISRYV
ncbi:hypothetical protein PXNS11_170037 [Stutzerimonas xanthomarina]|nr:hypothetical protein PXNS11_170037 [Stutzerimonas xanthomarina]